jgi:hypothetical protein
MVKNQDGYKVFYLKLKVNDLKIRERTSVRQS